MYKQVHCNAQVKKKGGLMHTIVESSELVLCRCHKSGGGGGWVSTRKKNDQQSLHITA